MSRDCDSLPENTIVVSPLGSLYSAPTLFIFQAENGIFVCNCVCVQVGCGAAGVDFLATVATYPKPDDKIRSTSFKVLSVIASCHES